MRRQAPLFEERTKSITWLVDSARDEEAALELLARWEYDAIVLDLIMPRKNGFEVIEAIRRDQPELLLRTIVVTAASNRTLQDGNVERLERLVRLIRKPFDLGELVNAVLACRRPSRRRSIRASPREGRASARPQGDDRLKPVATF